LPHPTQSASGRRLTRFRPVLSGVYTVVVEYKEEEPARVAFETALRLTLAAMHDEPVGVQGALEDLLALADEHLLAPGAAAIVAAARETFLSCA